MTCFREEWRTLTVEQVLEIRERLAAGEKGAALAKGRSYAWLKKDA